MRSPLARMKGCCGWLVDNARHPRRRLWVTDWTVDRPTSTIAAAGAGEIARPVTRGDAGADTRGGTRSRPTAFRYSRVGRQSRDNTRPVAVTSQARNWTRDHPRDLATGPSTGIGAGITPALAVFMRARRRSTGREVPMDPPHDRIDGGPCLLRLLHLSEQRRGVLRGGYPVTRGERFYLRGQRTPGAPRSACALSVSMTSGSTLTLRRCGLPTASGGRRCDNSCSALSGRTVPFGPVCVQPLFSLR
jgi:hypothetical protein